MSLDLPRDAPPRADRLPGPHLRPSSARAGPVRRRSPARPGGFGPYFGPRFALRFRATLSARLFFALVRFVFDRFATFRLERFPRFTGMLVFLSAAGGRVNPALLRPRDRRPGSIARPCGRRLLHRSGYSSQSRSFSFLGRYSSVMKEMPRRERASSSYFSPERTISWISFCHFAFWNQG